MSRFPKLTTVIRSTVVALAIGGAAITAAPVQAAPPIIDFHFGFGGGGISIGGGRYCLSDRQVRFLLRTQGYDHIRFFDRRSLGRCLRHCGFTPREWKGFGRPWPLYKSFFVTAEKTHEPQPRPPADG